MGVKQALRSIDAFPRAEDHLLHHNSGSDFRFYWLEFAGFYLLAKLEEAADRPIYSWTHHILSRHSIKHLCAAMVPVFLTLMLAKRTIQTERDTIEVQAWNYNGREEVGSQLCPDSIHGLLSRAVALLHHQLH